VSTLTYHGRPLTFATVDGEEPHAVALWLGSGRARIVVLEPGDATRYRLRLEPCEASGALVVSKMDAWGQPAEAQWAVTLTRAQLRGVAITPDLFLHEPNEWSRTLIAHYLTLLFAGA
jgi:hypothetical protein